MTVFPCEYIKGLKHPSMVDPGMLIYHPLPKVSEFRTVFQALISTELTIISGLVRSRPAENKCLITK